MKCKCKYEEDESMAEIKCPKCEQMIDENLKQCNFCGYMFEEETIKENNKILDEVEKDEKVQIVNEVEENKELKPKKNFDKRAGFELVLGILLVILLAVAVSAKGKYNTLSKEYSSVKEQLAKGEKENKELAAQNKELKSQNEELTAQNIELVSKNDELENGARRQLADIKNAFEKGEWETVIDLASTLHEKYNGSSEDAEAQKLAKTSKKNIEEEKAKREAEKAKGYETGITYNQLARTPDKYEGKKVKFSGKVIQVIEGDDTVQIRLAVKNNYDTVLLGEYRKDIVSSRVLEDDHITIYGVSVGTISYKSTMGGTITIPGVYIDKIKQ